MTTFHESQPQSRRAARQSERDESVEQAEFTGQPPESAKVYSPEDSGDAWNDARTASGAGEPGDEAPKGRRAAAPAGPPALVSEPPVFTSGQKTPVPSYDGPSFVSRVSSTTRPDGDSPVTGSNGSELRADEAHGGQAFPPTQALAQVDTPAYRVRDYSPEGRRSAPGAPATTGPDVVGESPEAVPGGPAGASGSSPTPASPAPYVFRPGAPRPQFFVPESALADTVVAAMVRSDSADRADNVATTPHENAITPDGNAADSGESAPHIVDHSVGEHPVMTRRELRALEAQRSTELQPPPALPEFASDGSLTGAAAAVFVETDFDDDSADAGEPAIVTPALPPQLVDPILGNGPTVLHAAAPASVDDVAADDAAAVDEVPFVEPTLTPFDALFKVLPAEPRSAPAELAPLIEEPVTIPAPAVDALLAPAVFAKSDSGTTEGVPSVSAPSKSVPQADKVVGFATAPPESAVGETPPAQPSAGAPSPWSPPLGHWSAQDDVDEDALVEGKISRTIGSGILTTNALVLPTVPEGTDIRGPLTGTGEIMLTGSIDLPRTLSSTGQTDRFDGENIDALFDLNDAEVISTDSSPVRAIRAVSTHTSGHGVTHTQKPKGTRALTGLLIAASSLAVAVAGLLVAAFAFNIF